MISSENLIIGESPERTEPSFLWTHVGRWRAAPKVQAVLRTVTVCRCSFKIPEGHYCLNDVHKASREDQKHRPKYLLENAHTQALVSEAEKGGFPPVSVNAERHGERS